MSHVPSMEAGPVGGFPDTAILCAPPHPCWCVMQSSKGSVPPQFPFLPWTGEPGLPGSCLPGPSHLFFGSLSPYLAFSSPKAQTPGILIPLTHQPEEESETTPSTRE